MGKWKRESKGEKSRRGRNKWKMRTVNTGADGGGHPHLAWSRWWGQPLCCLLLETDGTVRVRSKVTEAGPTHTDANTKSTHLSMHKINSELSRQAAQQFRNVKRILVFRNVGYLINYDRKEEDKGEYSVEVELKLHYVSMIRFSN